MSLIGRKSFKVHALPAHLLVSNEVLVREHSPAFGTLAKTLGSAERQQTIAASEDLSLIHTVAPGDYRALEACCIHLEF